MVAGALIAVVSRYLGRGSEARERRDALLLDQLTVLVALSEDYRNRVWEERHKVATGVVAAWDIGAYRMAEARLRILCHDPNVLSALISIAQAGTELGKSWRISPKDEARTQAAWEAHRAAVDQFIAASSQVFRRQPAPRGRSSVLAIPPIGAPRLPAKTHGPRSGGSRSDA